MIRSLVVPAFITPITRVLVPVLFQGPSMRTKPKHRLWVSTPPGAPRGKVLARRALHSHIKHHMKG